MKTSVNNLFSLTAIDADYYGDNEDKIELLNCDSINKKCQMHLKLVNNSFKISDVCRRDKNFSHAVEVLKSAYITTFELTEPSCIKCGELFRSTISESLENIHSELRKLSGGIIKRKRFQSSYQFADNVLNELKDMDKNPKPRVKKDIKHFIESYQKKNVS